MRQRPDAGPTRIAEDQADKPVREGWEMNVGLAVTVYGTPRRASPDRPAVSSLADPDVTEH
jgi:hypothetical protein